MTIFSLAKELPGKKPPNPVLRDVYIAVSCSGRSCYHPRPSPDERGFFFREPVNCAAPGWIAVHGNLVDTECGWRRKVFPDFFLDVSAALLHRIEGCFFGRTHHLATGASNLPTAAAAARSITGSAGVMLTCGRSDHRAQFANAPVVCPARWRPTALPVNLNRWSSLLRLDPDKSGRWARTRPRSWPPRTHRDRRCGTVLRSDKPWIRGDGRGKLVSLALLR